jgi:hypothetical protein
MVCLCEVILTALSKQGPLRPKTEFHLYHTDFRQSYSTSTQDSLLSVTITVYWHPNPNPFGAKGIRNGYKPEGRGFESR